MKTNEMFNLKSSQAHKGELIDSSRTSSVNVSINYLNAKFWTCLHFYRGFNNESL